jgi:hypothetical protein
MTQIKQKSDKFPVPDFIKSRYVAGMLFLVGGQMDMTKLLVIATF